MAGNGSGWKFWERRKGARAPWVETETPTNGPLIKASTWVWIAVVGALGGAITDVAQPRFVAALNSVVEWGDPVEVEPELQPEGLAMWLPGTQPLSAHRIQELNDMETSDQIRVMESQGGIVMSNRELRLLLTSNRQKDVSIVDIRPISECTDYGPGSLVMTEFPMAGKVANSQLIMAVDDPSKKPIAYDPDDTSKVDKEFFDEQHIILKKDDLEVVILHLDAGSLICSVDIELTVQEGQKKHKQRVYGRGNEITVAGNDFYDQRDIRHAYMGGDRCDEYMQVPTVPEEIRSLWSSGPCPSKEFG